MFWSKFSPKFGWQKNGTADAVPLKKTPFKKNVHFANSRILGNYLDEAKKKVFRSTL